MVRNYLEKSYKQGEPIFTTDIDIPGMTDANRRYHLGQLVERGVLRRFDAGIYYFPKYDTQNRELPMDNDTVAAYKYVMRRWERVGYYSGSTLTARLGLLRELPEVKEITSNLAPAIIREVSICGNKYLLRRPIVEVCEENVLVLQFLDCLMDMERCVDVDEETCGRILSSYLRGQGITKEQVDAYIYQYPDRTFRSYYRIREYLSWEWEKGIRSEKS